MTVDEIYQVIAERKPSIIYISGKTSTGKSTFGRKLRDNLGYHVIELEAVLLKIVKEHSLDEQSTFRKVLSEAAESKEKSLFLQATDQVISDALAREKPVVIEGAVANIETLERILQPAKDDLLFLYFHPTAIDIYIRNLTNRFMQSSEDSYGGLPLKFWRLVDDKAFTLFCRTKELSEGLKKSIAQYAQSSQKESLTRLDECQKKFKNISVIEIR